MELKSLLQEFGAEQKELIHILHRVQLEFGYIPPQAIKEISRRLGISEGEIFGVLTFYKAFTLEPRGKHTVTVCMGTACHVRGGPHIVEEFERKLGINAGETTPDREFSLETVNCLGCCAIGPVVVMDGRYFSHVTIQKIKNILKESETSE